MAQSTCSQESAVRLEIADCGRFQGAALLRWFHDGDRRRHLSNAAIIVDDGYTDRVDASSRVGVPRFQLSLPAVEGVREDVE